MKKLKTLFKGLLLALPVIGLIVVLGAGCIQENIIPEYIEPESIEYSGQKPTLWLPFTTMADADRINAWMNYNHSVYQVELARLQEDDISRINFLQQRADFHRANAEEIKSIIFSPDSPVSAIVTTLLAGTVGATLIPRKREKDLEKEVVKLQNGSK